MIICCHSGEQAGKNMVYRMVLRKQTLAFSKEKQLMKKCLTMLIVIAMLLSMASCGQKTQDKDSVSNGTETTADTTVKEEESETEEVDPSDRSAVSDNLPEKDFGGKNFTILAESGALSYLYVDELTGDSMEDAAYNRNQKLAERFNVKFNFIDGQDYQTISETISNAVISGETIYDVAINGAIQQGINANGGCYRAWNDVPFVDFTKPWWNASMTSDLSYEGFSFLAQGDADVSAIMNAGAIFYNKDLGTKYNFPDLYQIVREGKWTKDQLTALCIGTYVDVNGDGARDAGDQYGFCIDSKEDVNGWLWAFGKKIYEKNDDGTFTNVYYDEKLVNIVEWMYNFKYNTDYCYTDDQWNTGYNMMSAGQTVFADDDLSHALWMRDVDLDFAILPKPKWDEAQESYITPVDGGGSCSGVMLGAQDLEMVGIMMEAIHAESWRSVTPVIVDTVLKFKGARDADSMEMIDLILAGRFVDFGLVYGGWGSARSALRRVIDKAHSTDIASYYEENKPTWDATMDSVFAAFEELVEKNQ